MCLRELFVKYFRYIIVAVDHFTSYTRSQVVQMKEPSAQDFLRAVMGDVNTINSLRKISRGHGSTTFLHAVCSAGKEQSPDARVVAEVSI